MRRRSVFYFLMFAALLVLAACAGDTGPQGPEGPAGPAGPQGPAGPAGEAAVLEVADLSCTGCHNDTSELTGMQVSWSESLHGSGETTAYAGSRTSCTGCHSGSGFTAAMAAGVSTVADQASAATNPSRVDCRACHEIHTSYTTADWALSTTEPVQMAAFEGEVFDGGEGNLCANCHQARRGMDEAVDGMVNVTSTHWGPHHGPQAAMLLGLAGAPGVEGSPSSHATLIEDTCVSCHMGEGANHTYTPDVSACTSCHSGAENFDINGVQTEVQGMLDELETALIAKGWLDEEGHPAVAAIPESEAAALWNWIYVAHEDKSLGVHNPAYTKALLQAGLDALAGG